MNRRYRVMFRTIVATVVLVAAAAGAYAFINPNFTPIHLTEQSDLVAIVKFDGTVKDGKATAKVTQAIKGEAPGKPLTFDLAAGAAKAGGEKIANMIRAGTRDALLFVGFFEPEDGGGMGPGEEGAKGRLHIGGEWITLESFEEGLWEMGKISSQMKGTWAGSTDMLLRALRYILSDPDADVPVCTNAEWGKQARIGKFPGKVRALRPVDLRADGKLSLYVASDAGDRLFQWKDGAFAETTADHKLISKSAVALWADLNGDGKADLISFDGKELTVFRQKADGTLSPGAMKTGDALRDGCLSLSAVRPADKSSLIVIGTSASPVVLALPEAGPVSHKRLVEGEFPGKNFGKAGACLVADFDGDALPDILQPFEAGALFYKGGKDGEFAPPVETRIGLGKGRSTAQLGDYDADGLLDIFVSAEDTNRIWHNLGEAKFVETLALSGEIEYISKPGGVDGMTGDVNNDGRQDILIAYGAMAPQIFFNRGFRSF